MRVETSLKVLIGNFLQNSCDKLSFLSYSHSIPSTIEHDSNTFLFCLVSNPQHIEYSITSCFTMLIFHGKFMWSSMDSTERKVSPIQKSFWENEITVSPKDF